MYYSLDKPYAKLGRYAPMDIEDIESTLDIAP